MLNPTYEKAEANVVTKPDIFFGHLFITVAISSLKSLMELCCLQGRQKQVSPGFNRIGDWNAVIEAIDLKNLFRISV